MISRMMHTHVPAFAVAATLSIAFAVTILTPAQAQGPFKKLGQPTPKVTIEHQEPAGKFRIEIDGELFTEYSYKGHRMPILYPVHGVGGAPMTRNYPMKNGVGEAQDHPHHRSLWFAHGEVNGHDFWHGKNCRVVQDKAVTTQGKNVVTLSADNSWFVGEKRICREQRRVVFHVQPEGRFIDYEVKIMATEGDLHFGDTKEGTMAIRTNPALRLRAVKGSVATGKARNSGGKSGKGIWGKRARWVDYFGPVAGKVVGVAIFDHPSNHGHPCRWHARDYGLVAANPWGVGPFERTKKGPGQRLKKGESVTLKYRFYFHAGDTEQAGVAAQWEKFAKMPGSKVKK